MLKDLVTETDEQTHLGPEARFILDEIEANWRKTGSVRSGNEDQLNKAMGLSLTRNEVFLVQYRGPGDGEVLFTDKGLQEHFCSDAPKLMVADLFEDQTRETALELMDASFALPAIVNLPLTAQRGAFRKPLRAELLLLPIFDGPNRTKFLIAALVTDGRGMPSKSRFELSKDVSFRCEALQSALPDRRTSKGPQLFVDNTAA